MTEIKPCPFCGTSGESIEVKDDDLGVTCHGCGVWMPERVSSDITRNHGALEGWNRRVLHILMTDPGKNADVDWMMRNLY